VGLSLVDSFFIAVLADLNVIRFKEFSARTWRVLLILAQRFNFAAIVALA
jgi:hypothetical protein